MVNMGGVSPSGMLWHLLWLRRGMVLRLRVEGRAVEGGEVAQVGKPHSRTEGGLVGGRDAGVLPPAHIQALVRAPVAGARAAAAAAAAAAAGFNKDAAALLRMSDQIALVGKDLSAAFAGHGVPLLGLAWEGGAEGGAEEGYMVTILW